MNIQNKPGTKISLKAFIAGFPVIVFLITCGTENSSDVSIYETKVNRETSPAGIDDEAPVFSWKLASEERNRYQSAYQVVVLSGNTKDTCWNSGKVFSDNSIQVKYSGIPLKPVNFYTWKVRIWDNAGKRSPWSDENHFSTGLMGENDWNAEWISSPDKVYSPVFIKEFSIDRIPDRAEVFVNCQGYFELYINGEKAGNDVLSPAVSDFRFENYYLTYDIHDYLKTGKNTIGLWTGRGWYSYGLPGVIYQSPVFRLQAHLYSGDASAILISDTTWMT